MVSVKIAATTVLATTKYVALQLSTRKSVGQLVLKILKLVTEEACWVRQMLPHWRRRIELQEGKKKGRGGWV